MNPLLQAYSNSTLLLLTQQNLLSSASRIHILYFYSPVLVLLSPAVFKQLLSTQFFMASAYLCMVPVVSWLLLTLCFHISLSFGPHFLPSDDSLRLSHSRVSQE